MKRIYNIILLFALSSGALFAHEGHEHSSLIELQEVNFSSLSTQVKNNGVFNEIRSVTNDPASPITAIPVAVENDSYTFHFYTADGKIYSGYTEIFIALKDEEGNLVEDFSISNFAPIMDMGTMSHSTPIGKVEKVEDQPLYKTWIAGLMGGDWTLDFDYAIGDKTGTVAGAGFFVSGVPAGQKWLQSLGGTTKLYASIAYPQSYTDGGAQVLQAYINRNVVSAEPYQIVEGGYKIVVTPSLGTTTLPAVTLLWNAEKGIYEGDVNFSQEGLWTLYFKVLDASSDALIAGDNGTSSTLTWKINVECGDDTGINPIVGNSDVKVYPAFTIDEVTVEVPVDAQIDVVSLSGQRLKSRSAYANTPLTLNLSGKGLYLISIQTANGEVVTRKVVVK
jgi:hypothetical protein